MPLIAAKAFAAYVNGRRMKVKKGETLDGMTPATQEALVVAGVVKAAPRKVAKEKNDD